MLSVAGDADAQPLVEKATRNLEVIGRRIAEGDREGAARQFVEEVAFGPGTWDTLPAQTHTVMTQNAPTYLDELQDPDQVSIDTDALARLERPVRLTVGTESPPLLGRVVDRLMELIPHASRATIEGAGHVPHLTHPSQLVELTTRALQTA